MSKKNVCELDNDAKLPMQYATEESLGSLRLIVSKQERRISNLEIELQNLRTEFCVESPTLPTPIVRLGDFGKFWDVENQIMYGYLSDYQPHRNFPFVLKYRNLHFKYFERVDPCSIARTI